MPPGRSLNYFHLLKAFFAGCLFIILMASCVVVKKYPIQKPYVYQTNINVIGNFNNKDRATLASALRQQLDDSLRARRKDNLFWQTLKNPPLYDSTNADKSIVFMRALLISLGYFDPSLHYDKKTDTVRTKEYRTTVTFEVTPGRLWTIDTIVYNLGDAGLQKLADSTSKSALIKKGAAFATAPISAEIDRLTELYRNNGYLRFTRDDLVGVWDTLDVSLLQPTLDPLEQLQLLEQLRQRRKTPTVKLELKLNNIDSIKLTRYYNGHVTIFPDYTTDTAGLRRKTTVDSAHHITVIQYRNKFKPRIFPPNIYLPHDSLYRLRRYIRTVNRLNLMGAWRLVTIDQSTHKDTVDYQVRLTPAKKYSFTTNIEGSINQSATSGTLFGIGVNAGIQNRNFNKTASFDSWNARYGVELGGTGSTNQFIQSQQLSIGRNIVFPRALLLNNKLPENRRDNFRTILGANVSNVIRRDLYKQSTFNSSFAWEYQRRNKLYTWRLLNVEFSVLHKKDSLDHLIYNNPSLKNIFTDGLIVSTMFNYTVTGGKRNDLNVLRVNAEGAPLFFGLIRHSNFLDSQLYRFVKFDVEAARLIRYPKTSLVFRGFFGMGIADPFGTTVNPLKQSSLPFFKQYFAGGPNSMRAWALRRLGPGSIVKDFVGKDGAPDRYGDVQFETNAEFRFPIGRPFGIKLNGATFVDIGNVWLLKDKAGPPEAVFNLGRMWEQLAVGAGAGLRIDFNFFVVRLDYSYKVKDPSPTEADASLQNKWFGYKFFKGDQFQLGIGYPFIF